MPKYADYIKRIEIDSLWSGKRHILWELNPGVNILSGIYDVIRSLDSPVLDLDTMAHVDTRISSALDFQLYHLQRKYLDYQVNIGNRIIAELQAGNADAAQQLSLPKQRFQDMVDDLFSDTGKKIVRTENEIRFSQIGETLVPYQLSSGEKQMLAILLTVLVEDISNGRSGSSTCVWS